MATKTLVKITINTLIGLVLVIIWLHFVDFNEIIKTLSKVSPSTILPIILFMLTGPILRALRLKILLSNFKKIDLLDLIFLNGIATSLNFFIPVRAGEIAKGIYLNTNYKLDLGKSLMWIFIDRFIDFFVVLLVCVSLLTIVPTSLGSNFILTLSLIFGGVTLASFLVIYQAKTAKKITIFLRHLLIFNVIKIYFDRFSDLILESFKILKRPAKDLFLIIFITILAYGTEALMWYFTFIALNSPQSFVKMYLAQVLSALTYLIPAAPGYIGSAEASGLLIFSGVLGINSNLSSAMIVLFHIITAIFIIVYGLISLYFLKMDLSLILKKALNRS